MFKKSYDEIINGTKRFLMIEKVTPEILKNKLLAGKSAILKEKNKKSIKSLIRSLEFIGWVIQETRYFQR